MTNTATPRQPTVSSRTQQQQQAQLVGWLFLVLLFGPLNFVVGVIIYILARLTKTPRAFLWVGLGALVGLITLAVQWRVLQHDALDIYAVVQPLIAQSRGRSSSPAVGSSVNLLALAQQVWPPLWALWTKLLLFTPAIALYLNGARVKTAEELERETLAVTTIRQARAAQQGQHQSAKAPVAVQQQLVLGAPISGDLPWTRKNWFLYPADQLGQHVVVIGGSGTGKSETSLRLAFGAAKVYGWKVFFLDCKGHAPTAERFLAAMRAAGHTKLAYYPEESYDGWKGDATAIFNRLMAITRFSEPYYRDITKTMLNLALRAPEGPPRSSDELLERLNLEVLERIYAGRPEARDVARIRTPDADGVWARYHAFFSAVRGMLDGNWSFDDVDAGYIRLDGLALKDETESIGRFVLEDFAHWVSQRKPMQEKTLLIMDEFSAIATGGTDAANLFERVRSFGAGVLVTSQSYAGVGDDADRILGAATGVIVHRCPDPERVIARAGHTTVFQRRVGYVEQGIREYATGQGAIGVNKEWKIDPDHVKALPQGSCFVIANGQAARIHVSAIQLKQEQQGAEAGSQQTSGVIWMPAERVRRERVAPTVASFNNNDTEGEDVITAF